MIPNPIRKVLSSIQKHRVRALLMGGQACVLYGAAEFSRDTDLAILANADNLDRLRRALAELHAETIAVPAFELGFLKRGHAVHFRCQHPEALRLRVDVMSRMRGVDAFPKLWRRRTTIHMSGGITCHLLSLRDLVQAKKTQRDKDWPMLRRLVEADYFQQVNVFHRPVAVRVRFWLLELRTPQLLVEVAQRHPATARRFLRTRPLIAHAVAGDSGKLERALFAEERAEREIDRRYWLPLREELEQLRHGE